jgi:hypothetical protein
MRLWLDKSNPYIANLRHVVGPDWEEGIKSWSEAKVAYKRALGANKRLLKALIGLGIGSIVVLFNIYWNTLWYAFWKAWIKEDKK